MLYWIRRFSKMLALLTFIIIFFLKGINYENLSDLTLIFPAIIKGLIGAVIFWVAGFVISDIVFKGIVEDIPNDDLDILDGGIVQRMKQYGNKVHFKSIADNVKNELPKKDDEKSGN